MPKGKEVATETPVDDAATAENGDEKKKRTRTPMPFGRQFGITVKFHNDLNAERRTTIVDGILESVKGLADNETTDVHRSTRGEPNENLQTWLIAPYGYDWPEKSDTERGIRLPAGPLANAIKAFAAKHDLPMEEAISKFMEAFGIPVEEEEAETSENGEDAETAEESESES